MFSIIIIAAIFGAYFRFLGLGKWPFASSDEYYIAKSVQSILKNGFPKFEFGGYYFRSPVYQYLAAFFMFFGVKDEFALRLIPVLFNLASLPAVYLLGKKIGGKIIGAVAVFVFSFSVWEIEIARYARMYAPFQAIFLWYFYFLYIAVIEKNKRFIKWMYGFSIISIFIYEASIFLAILNFIPIFLRFKEFNRKQAVYSLILSTLIFVFAYFYITFDFRFSGTSNNLPPDVSIEHYHTSSVDLPVLLLQVFPSSMGLMSLFIVILLYSLFSLYRINKEKIDMRVKFVFACIVIFSILNQFGLVFFSVLLFFLIDWISLRHLRLKSLKFILSSVIINLVYWIFYAMTTNKWIEFFSGLKPQSKIKKLFIALFDYPDLYYKIFDQYIVAMPYFTILTVIILGIGFLFLFFKKGAKDEGFKFFIFTIVSLCLLVAITNPPYKSARYTFFLFPVVLISIIYIFLMVTQKIKLKNVYSNSALLILTLLFLLASEDFNLHHVFNIDSKEVNFRMIYGADTDRAGLYISRHDVKTPAEVVNKNLSSDDIVLSTVRMAEYYLNRLDYFYYNFSNKEFSMISVQNGTKDIWTNSNLVYTKEKLYDFIESCESNIWLVIYSKNYKNVDEEEIALADKYSQYLFFKGIDDKVEVYRIPPQN